jgi:WD40 repeat protein
VAAATIKAAGGAISAKVAALAEGVLKAMLVTKLKFATAVALAVVVAIGVCAMTFPAPAAQPPGPGKAVRPAARDGNKPAPGPKPVVVRDDAQVHRLAWGPIGKVLATVAVAFEIVRFKDKDGNDAGRGACWPSCTIKLRNAKTGKLERSLAEEKHANIMALACSPDGKLAAVSLAKMHEVPWKGKSEVRLVDGATWAVRHKVALDYGAGASALAFSPDGSRLALGGASWLVQGGSFLQLWDVRKQKRLGGWADEGPEPRAKNAPPPARMGKGRVACLAFSPDGKALAAGDQDGKVRLFDGRTGELTRVLEGHKAWAVGVGFAPDGKSLISASADGTVKLWDVKAGKLRRTLEGNKGPVHALAFSRDGKRFATGGSAEKDGKEAAEVIVWDTRTGKPKTVLADQAMLVLTLAFSPDGGTLAVGAGDRIIPGPGSKEGRLETPSELKLWPLAPDWEKK